MDKIMEQRLEALERRVAELEYQSSEEYMIEQQTAVLKLAAERIKDALKEKKAAELEGQVPAQIKVFIPEDSNGKHYEISEKTNC